MKDQSFVNAGAFGPKLSGKTTLAKYISRTLWTTEQRATLVLDPHLEEWGEQAKAFTNEEQFWTVVWKSRRFLIIVEEAAATISRNRELIPVFTRLRHNDHKLLVIGHSGMDLLPTMRQQIDTLFLFRQPESAAKVWSEVMAEKGLMQSSELQQYEFLHHKMFGKPQKKKLPPSVLS